MSGLWWSKPSCPIRGPTPTLLRGCRHTSMSFKAIEFIEELDRFPLFIAQPPCVHLVRRTPNHSIDCVGFCTISKTILQQWQPLSTSKNGRHLFQTFRSINLHCAALNQSCKRLENVENISRMWKRHRAPPSTQISWCLTKPNLCAVNSAKFRTTFWSNNTLAFVIVYIFHVYGAYHLWALLKNILYAWFQLVSSHISAPVKSLMRNRKISKMESRLQCNYSLVLVNRSLAECKIYIIVEGVVYLKLVESTSHAHFYHVNREIYVFCSIMDVIIRHSIETAHSERCTFLKIHVRIIFNYQDLLLRSVPSIKRLSFGTKNPRKPAVSVMNLGLNMHSV